MLSLISTSPEHTRQLGQALGALLQPGDCICLQGDLGAGKTTFVQGVAAGWGTRDEVSSPTFVLINVYRNSNEQRLFHLDTYRIESPAEAEELDLDAMLTQGPLLIEWPERIQPVLPAEHLWIHLGYLDDTRRQLTLRATGQRPQQLLRHFQLANHSSPHVAGR
ncbi:MAG: tRNA (adenosine(37)-N6)-threonylcarbamoyltransferase complex ATPase subunit type 1 TsaE [Anaerolineae bacterium]|nr:MAG: tRNA (adenosine(37)-N6)-threonylcarbamoyltransferase complex ATPase subunit type 1 TsaE [Anaerolineae bacterium]